MKPTYEELEARNHDLLMAIRSTMDWYNSLGKKRRDKTRHDVFASLLRVVGGERTTRLDRVQLFKDAVFAACAVRNRDGAEDWTAFDVIMEKLE